MKKGHLSGELAKIHSRELNLATGLIVHIALGPDKLQRQGHWVRALHVVLLYKSNQIRKELVAPFQHTDAHQWTCRIPHNISSQSRSPKKSRDAAHQG